MKLKAWECVVLILKTSHTGEKEPVTNFSSKILTLKESNMPSVKFSISSITITMNACCIWPVTAQSATYYFNICHINSSYNYRYSSTICHKNTLISIHRTRGNTKSSNYTTSYMQIYQNSTTLRCQDKNIVKHSCIICVNAI